MKSIEFLSNPPSLLEDHEEKLFSEATVLGSICRESFYEFLKEFWKVIVNEELVLNWHIEYLCGELQAIAERVFLEKPKLYDTIINIPPGTSKSTIVSQMFPAWVWTKMPSAKFICASYAHMIAQKDSLRTRDLVESDLYKRCFPDLELREDENTKGLFVNTKMGFRLAAGVGGAITGLHGHFLIIDDPLNPEQAYSEPELKMINRWFETTLPSRKINKQVTPTIIVQQRLHQFDPSGEMLAKSQRPDSGKAVRHICLPGELHKSLNPPELKRFYVKGLLDPVRLPKAVLEDLRSDLGEYGYASQILQDPVPLGGGLFKTDKLKIVEECKVKMVRIVRSWDKAGTQDGGMWSVGVLIGMDKHNATWILNVVRGQWAAREREEKMQQTASQDGFLIKILLEIEGGSGGKESGENSVRNLAGYHVVTFHPTGDKETRAYPLASQVGAGNVYVLNRSWTKDYIDEMRFFPRSKFKDQMDASSAGFNYIARKKRKIGGF